MVVEIGQRDVAAQTVQYRTKLRRRCICGLAGRVQIDIVAEHRDVRQADHNDGANRERGVVQHRSGPRTRDPQGELKPKRKQHEHGGTPAAEEQEVGAALAPMMRGAERAEDERGGCQHQDEKP